jgi:methylated-DNA-protein-cysteine methyltransferase-like protein
MNKNFAEKVYKTVQKIPLGKVATYGQVAMLCGSSKAARAVGTALHRNPSPDVIACHRIVNRSGCLAKNFGFGGQESQKRLLELEGVLVDEDYRVNLYNYQWDEKNK